MQRLSGVLMVLAGTALGGYMVLPAPQTSADKPAEIARISAASDSVVPQIVTAAIAQPSSSTGTETAQSTISKSDPSAARVFSPSAPLAQPAAGTSTWTAVVTSEPAANGKLSSSKPGDASTRAALASDLQRELKRVGCYDGDITGNWTPTSKRAMSAFMERVNATLPVEEPDYILLTLVQGHAAIACGGDCPAGQVQAGAGRCVPQAVVAQASRKTQRDEDRRAAEERKAQQQERLALEQRAAEANRLAEARKAADATRLAEVRKAAEKSTEEARVAAANVPPPPAPKPAVRPPVQKPQQTAAAQPEQLPWLENVPAATKPASTPLPGMMSVGAPRATAPEIPASAAIAPARSPRPAVIEDLLDSNIDNKSAAAATTTPSETPATAPAPQTRKTPVVRQAAIPGLPGTKSGVSAQRPVRTAAVEAGLPGTKSGVAVYRPITQNRPPVVNKYRPARIVRRPPPVVVYAAPKPKPYYYASSSGGKSRRGQPRPGSMQYNIMQSLGGIY